MEKLTKKQVEKIRRSISLTEEDVEELPNGVAKDLIRTSSKLETLFNHELIEEIPSVKREIYGTMNIKLVYNLSDNPGKFLREGMYYFYNKIENLLYNLFYFQCHDDSINFNIQMDNIDSNTIDIDISVSGWSLNLSKDFKYENIYNNDVITTLNLEPVKGLFTNASFDYMSVKYNYIDINTEKGYVELNKKMSIYYDNKSDIHVNYYKGNKLNKKNIKIDHLLNQWLLQKYMSKDEIIVTYNTIKKK